MSTSKKLDEITELTMLLQNSWQGLTIDEMSDYLERPRRAIERLMEVIKEKFGDRLELVPQSKDRKKHWRLKKGSMNFLVTFSDLELSRLEKLSNSIKNEAERKSVLDVIEKIKVLNPTNYHKNDIDILLEAQGLAVRQYAKENIDSEIMEKIAYAIQSEQKIKISYTDSYGNYYEPIIEPYGLKIADNHYLIASESNKLKQRAETPFFIRVSGVGTGFKSLLLRTMQVRKPGEIKAFSSFLLPQKTLITQSVRRPEEV